MSKKAVLFSRVSMDDQGEPKRGLEDQIEAMRRYAQEHGYTVVAEISENDCGASETQSDQPRLDPVRKKV
jgi:DNA invertase Pin-like site-specific DNA recombinase